MILYVLLALTLALLAWPLSKLLFPATYQEDVHADPAQASVLTVGCSMDAAAHVRAQLLTVMGASGLAIQRMTLQPHAAPDLTTLTVSVAQASPQALAQVTEALASTPGVHRVSARPR